MNMGVSTDRGKVRKNNQDAYFIPDKLNIPLFIIADGMGGHKAGEVASSMVVKLVKNFFTSEEEELLKNNIDISETIKTSIEKANMEIYKKSIKSEEFHGMGTTITMAYFSEDKLYIGHIGDSRAYLLREDKLVQLTEDHSLVAELVRAGSISEEEAECHPQKNIITRAIGTNKEVDIDVIVESTNKNDILLLCTDGLTNMICDEEIKKFLMENVDLQKTCDNLVERANKLGGIDNVTVMAIKLV